MGVAPHERATVKWLCKECIYSGTNLQKAYHMRLDKFEEQALQDGGNAGGAYLDELGRTDLSDLAPEEFQEFLGLVLKGYADSMREIVRTEVPF